MATSKILYMKDCGGSFHGKHLKVALEYIIARKKTQDFRLVAGINCTPANAFETMKATKCKHHKIDGRQAYHLIISFVENEVDADTAFELTEKFVREYLGDDYEAVYAVHDNTDNIHSHIVFNSVNRVTGKKFRYQKGDWAKHIQPIVNRLCEEYGLSTIEIETDRAKPQEFYREWDEYKDGPFVWSDMIRRDIDVCLVQAESYEEFLTMLSEKGYEIKQGKHIAVKPMGMKKFRRLKSFGEDYTEERLRTRVLTENISTYKVETLEEAERIVYSKIPRGKRAKLTTLQKKYYARLYRIGLLKRKPYSQAWKYREDIRRMHKLQEQYLFLVNHDIDTVTDLCDMKEALTDKKKEVSSEKSKVYRQRKKCEDLFAVLEEMQHYSYAEQAYQSGDDYFVNEHQEWCRLEQKLKVLGYTFDEVVLMKEHYRSEIARTREEELSLRKEIRVAESILREIEEEDRDIDKIEEKEIVRDEQPRL